MILTCQDLSVAFGDEVLFSQVSFLIREQEKAAIVGENGCGKSTLLKVIVSELSPSEGSVIFGKEKTFGYLAQYQDTSDTDDIYHHVLHAREDILSMEADLYQMEQKLEGLKESEVEEHLNRYHEMLQIFDTMGGPAYRSEVTGVLKGLGFVEEEFSKHLDELSGGQKTRVNLAGLLMKKPDLLILDEPINHLDLKSIEWLEGYLLNYKGAVLIVAHDRYFLDRIAETIIDLSCKTVTVYKGNYSAFVRQKKERLLTQQRSYDKQQKEIAHQKEVIDKLKQFNREKSIKRAESREKMLSKMTVEDKPKQINDHMHLSLEPDTVSGKDVLFAEHLSMAFDGQSLFFHLSFALHRGERVALIGDNGTGKTTLLKILNQRISPIDGTFTLGTNVRIAYYDQEQQQLSDDKTLFEEMSDAYPSLSETKIRNVLAAFLFTKDTVYQKISTLSGGERGRVSLAKLMLSGANLLILDEPTNHLDMESKEILEEALCGYTGTVLFVSHDRYFISKVADRILELRDGTLFDYPGDYAYYLQKRDEAYYQSPQQKPSEEKNSDAGRLSWEEQKKQAALEKKKENERLQLESKIEALEQKIAGIDEMFLDETIAKNSARLNELVTEQEDLKKELEQCYEAWEGLM